MHCSHWSFADGKPDDPQIAGPALEAGYAELIETYSDRIAPFDLDGAYAYARILALQEEAGRHPGTADTQIAATALTRGMALATRNVRHFSGLGLELINPWGD